MKSLLAMLLAIAAIACAPASVAQSFSARVECPALKLDRAVGVPDGPAREYAFSGSCAIYHVSALSSLGSSTKSPKPYHTFPVKAEGAWDAKSNRFRETITILGQFSYLGTSISGSLTSTFACSYDPVTGPTACNAESHANSTNLPAFSKPYEGHTPILAGRATMQQAMAVAVPPRQAIRPAAKAAQEAMQPPRQPMAPVAGAVKDAMKTQATGTPANAASEPAPTSTPNDGCADVGEVALKAGARVALENGRVLASDDTERELRWALLAAEGEVLRRFPPESRAYRFSEREIVVDWGGGVFRAGRERQTRLKLPAGQ